MKKVAIVVSFLLMSIVSFAQMTRSDKVDSLGFVYLNAYRAYYGLPLLIKDNTFKSTCVKWCEEASKSNFEHTDLHNGAMGEVITGGRGFLNFRNPTEFSIFVKNITKKNISELNAVDILILDAIFQWEKSPKHKKILTNKFYSSVYFSIAFDVDRFNPVKDILYTYWAIVQVK